MYIYLASTHKIETANFNFNQFFPTCLLEARTDVIEKRNGDKKNKQT